MRVSFKENLKVVQKYKSITNPHMLIIQLRLSALGQFIALPTAATPWIILKKISDIILIHLEISVYIYLLKGEDPVFKHNHNIIFTSKKKKD